MYTVSTPLVPKAFTHLAVAFVFHFTSVFLSGVYIATFGTVNFPHYRLPSRAEL